MHLKKKTIFIIILMFYYWTVCAPETLQKFNFMQLAGEIGLACRSSRN